MLLDFLGSILFTQCRHRALAGSCPLRSSLLIDLRSSRFRNQSAHTKVAEDDESCTRPPPLTPFGRASRGNAKRKIETSICRKKEGGETRTRNSTSRGRLGLQCDMPRSPRGLGSLPRLTFQSTVASGDTNRNVTRHSEKPFWRIGWFPSPFGDVLSQCPAPAWARGCFPPVCFERRFQRRGHRAPR